MGGGSGGGSSFSFRSMSDQTKKRRNNDNAPDTEESVPLKRPIPETPILDQREHIISLTHFMPPPPTDASMPLPQPSRSKTPPLGMTLAHYNEASGGYSTSVVKSAQEFDSNICSGMTAMYRPAAERWGSSIL